MRTRVWTKCHVCRWSCPTLQYLALSDTTALFKSAPPCSYSLNDVFKFPYFNRLVDLRNNLPLFIRVTASLFLRRRPLSTTSSHLSRTLQICYNFSQLVWHPHFIRKCTSYAVFKLYTNEYSLNCNLLLLLLLLSYICVTRYTRTGNSVGVVITV